MGKKGKSFLIFCQGAIVGLLAAGAFGYFTYPDNPTFEGSGGYHYLGMIIVTPVASIVFGVTFYIVHKLRKRGESTDA